MSSSRSYSLTYFSSNSGKGSSGSGTLFTSITSSTFTGVSSGVSGSVGLISSFTTISVGSMRGQNIDNSLAEMRNKTETSIGYGERLKTAEHARGPKLLFHH